MFARRIEEFSCRQNGDPRVGGGLARNNPVENRYQRRGWWSLDRGVGARPGNIRSRKNTKCFADYSSPVESYASNTSERIDRVAVEHDRSFASSRFQRVVARINGDLVGILIYDDKVWMAKEKFLPCVVNE